jgi:predicted  nucleic acid-binding Zn-ribbon protein
MLITPAPPCTRCGKIYVHGRDGLCDGCRLRPTARTSRITPRPVLCDCGQPAVQVILVHVGDPEKDNYVEERMPLCPACLQLELEM